MKTSIASSLADLFEKLQLRCSNCGGWRTFKKSTRDVLKWGGNMGGLVHTDPYYLSITTHTCADCGHITSEKTELSARTPL